MALKRLRKYFDDPLFVRTARTMEPTPRAHELWQQVKPILDQAESALIRPDDKDPGQFSGVLRLGLSDDHELFLHKPLLELIRKQAPDLRIAFRQTDRHRLKRALEQGDIDLAIGVVNGSEPWLVSTELVELSMTALVASGAYPKRKKLTLKQYIEGQHVIVSYDGELTSRVDESLAKEGYHRQVVAAYEHFFSVGQAVANQAVIATVPVHVGNALTSIFALKLMALPINLASFSVQLAHHRRNQNHRALQWLAQQISSIYQGN